MGTRTFLAIDTPGKIRKSVDRLIGQLRGTSASVKWVESEHLHLTLKFFGDVGDADIVSISQAVSAAVKGNGPITFHLGGVGAFPSTERPRTIWVGVTQGEAALADLQERIECALQPLGIPRENRRFHAHLTVGRVRGGGGQRELAERIERHHDFEGGDVVVDQVQLIASQLRPSGPVYTVFSRFPLT